MKHRCLCVLIIANVLQHFVIDAWVKGLLLTFSSIRISSKSLSIFPDSISGRDISPSILRSEKKLSSREQGAEIRKLLQSPEHEWMHATVHSVSPFGLFVRPAGFSIIGLLHKKNIPLQLTSDLQRRLRIINSTYLSPPFSSHNFSRPSINRLMMDPLLDQLFQKGDQICVRILQSVNPLTALTDTNFGQLKVNFTMLLKTTHPTPTMKPSERGQQISRNTFETRSLQNLDQKQPPATADGGGLVIESVEDLIRTWRGLPFVRVNAPMQQRKDEKPIGVVCSNSTGINVDRKWMLSRVISVANGSAVGNEIVNDEAPSAISNMEKVFLSENQQFRSGAWRRFIMKRSAVDATESRLRAAEREKRKLKTDIGKLAGLDKTLSDNSDGLGLKTQTVWARVHRLGSVVPRSFFPPEIVAQLDYYRNIDALLAPREKAIRAGKSFEIEETTKFQKLLDTRGIK